ADVKGSLPACYACGKVQAEIAGDAGAEVQKELLPSLSEAQHSNFPDKDKFQSAATIRKRTRLAVQWRFAHKLGSIVTQGTLARDGVIKSWRASEAQVVFVGSGAYEAGVEVFFFRFDAAASHD